MNRRAVPELLTVLESSLDTERDALLGADSERLTAASESKLQCMNDLSSLQQTQPAQLTQYHSRLREAMVANARNQALLAMLQARVESRMQDLGLLDATYDRGGRRSTRMTTRSVTL